MPAGADGVYHVEARTPGITQVTIAGPFNATGPGDTPSRRRLLVCTPASAAEELPCARTILSALATRAFRRPIAAVEPRARHGAGVLSRRPAAVVRGGIERAVARMLVDPQFLFRFEREPARVAAGTAYRVTDLELASRLSFFLWSSIPDDELLAVAAKGGLSAPATLERQVRRMLADPKADALVTNFASQWLYLRELQNARPDSPDFDGNLRQSFQRETELLFRTVLREDRSIVDLLDADFTFVDERLAEHYGIPGVRGSRMRRVELAPDSPRRGLLGHGSILTVTSAANRTSPVQRGKWVLENVLGAPPPQPPPGVETNLDGDPARVKAAIAAPADGAAPRQPGVRVVPQDHGPDRVRARELRPCREVARRSTAARRSTRPARWWTAPGSTAPTRCAARSWRAPTVCRGGGGEDADLCRRPRRCGRRTCRRCAPSRTARPPATIASRRSCSASSARRSSRCAPRPPPVLQ